MKDKEKFMREAISVSSASVLEGGGPFGAVIVREGKIIASGANTVTLDNDPTAHAEMNAIRAACRQTGDFNLEGCEIYTSCEPCPMCLGAIYWAGIGRIYYANDRHDAAEAGFGDAAIYDQIGLPPDERSVPAGEMLRDEALEAFRLWNEMDNKVKY